MSVVKKLYRNTEDKLIAGVCSGLAEYFSIDISLIRVLAIVTGLLTGGTVVLAYIIALVLVPEKPSNAPPLGKELLIC